MAQEFFKQLAELMQDRQECVINIKKIEGDLVIMVTPDIKKKGTALQMTGNPDEMDLNFIHELKKPVTAKAEFKAESVENPDLDEEDEEKDTKAKKAGKDKGGKKKSAVKKAVKPGADKKGKATDKTDKPKKKDAPVVKEKEVTPDPTKVIADEVAAKLKADKELFGRIMLEGKAFMEERKYALAEISFKSAVELFPNDEKAKKELIQATKWVGAMAKL